MIDASSRVSDALKRRRSGLGKFHREAAGADITPELLAEQQLHVRLVVDHENEEIHAYAPALRLTPTSRLPGKEKLGCDARHIWRPWRLAI